MVSRSKIYGPTPAFMLAALVAGSCFAIGHDRFYRRLNHSIVPTNNFAIAKFQLSEEQTNLKIGNAFAFLTKFFLTLAATVAFCQAFWQEAKQESAHNRTHTSLAQLDTKVKIIREPTAVVSLQVWRNSPLLQVVTTIVCLVPLMSIITPGTLTVRTTLHGTTENRYVPSLDFRNFKFDASILFNIVNGASNYAGPSIELQKTAWIVGSANSIIPVTPPAPNSSWSTTFNGPSLECSELTEQEADQTLAALIQYTNQTNCHAATGFFSWLQTDPGSNMSRPFVSSDSSNSLAFNDKSWITPANQPDTTTNATMSLYLAVLPGMMTLNYSGTLQNPYACNLDQPGVMSVATANPTLLRCDVRDRIYHLTYTFTNGVQNLEWASNQSSETVMEVVSVMNGPNDGSNDTSDCRASNVSGSGCSLDESILWRLSYQGVLDSFSQLTLGTINLDPNGDLSIDVGSNILSTSLGTTNELRFLSEYRSTTTSGLQAKLAEENATATKMLRTSSLSDAANNLGNISLSNAMETMFRNITFSLMSSPAFQPENSSMAAPKTVEVTFTPYKNTYTYSQARLWLANGLALLLTGIAVSLSFFAIWKNSACCSDNISTGVRISQHTNLSKGVSSADVDGRDPLPAYLEKASIKFARKAEYEYISVAPVIVIGPRTPWIRRDWDGRGTP